MPSRREAYEVAGEDDPDDLRRGVPRLAGQIGERCHAYWPRRERLPAVFPFDPSVGAV